MLHSFKYYSNVWEKHLIENDIIQLLMLYYLFIPHYLVAAHWDYEHNVNNGTQDQKKHCAMFCMIKDLSKCGFLSSMYFYLVSEFLCQ